MPTMNDEQNLSTEEHLAEQVFGIMSEGENKYSFHPEYRAGNERPRRFVTYPQEKQNREKMANIFCVFSE